MRKQNQDRYRRPDLKERYERSQQHMQSMSDQEVTDRYSREMLKLKALNQFGRQSKQFKGYPNTLVMNLCRRILEHRNLPLPSLVLQEESNTTIPCNGSKLSSNTSCLSVTR